MTLWAAKVVLRTINLALNADRHPKANEPPHIIIKSHTLPPQNGARGQITFSTSKIEGEKTNTMNKIRKFTEYQVATLNFTGKKYLFHRKKGFGIMNKNS